MITNVTITPGTTADVVTLAKAKKHLRVEADFIDEDEIIQAYIDASVEMAENFIGGYITDKNIVIQMNSFDNPFVFEAFPVKSVTSVKYFAENVDDEAILAEESYKLTSETIKRFVLRYNTTLPVIQKRDDAVTVTVNVGMESVPKPIVQAILLMVADMFERREDRVETISTTSAALLRPYKKY